MSYAIGERWYQLFFSCEMWTKICEKHDFSLLRLGFGHAEMKYLHAFLQLTAVICGFVGIWDMVKFTFFWSLRNKKIIASCTMTTGMHFNIHLHSSKSQAVCSKRVLFCFEQSQFLEILTESLSGQENVSTRYLVSEKPKDPLIKISFWRCNLAVNH